MKFYIKSLYRPRAGMVKFLLVMKLIVLLLTTAILQVSANSFAQKITIQKKNIALQEVFSEIRKQTGYDVLWQPDKVDVNKTLNLSIKDQSLAQALEQILAGQSLDYTIKDKTVMIRFTEPSFLDRLAERWASIDVRGTVVDAETGQALAGANVKVKGTNRTTTTNEIGEFLLKGVDEQDLIVVSFIGYVTQEVKAEKNLGEIRLVMASSDLEEVRINKGYYDVKKELNTGSVSSIKAADIEKQPVSDPLGALQGRIPGLSIQQSSGVGGRIFNIAIRGQNSIANGNDPLFIVDGVQFFSNSLNTTSFTAGGGVHTSPLNSISPADIESITVLKDADATAIYGSRGANGVILITTKKGQSGATEASLNFYSGVGSVAKHMNLMKTQEYLEMRKSAFTNDNTQPSASDYDLNGAYDQNRYTDWQKVMIGRNAPITDLQSALSGGNKNTQFRIGLGYRSEGVVFPGDNSINRINGLISVMHKSHNEKLTIDFTGNYVKGENKLPNYDMTNLIFLAPNAPEIYTSDGKLNWQNNTWNNPFVEITKRYTENTANINTSANIGYKILPKLSIETRLGYNRNSLNQKLVIPFSAINPIASNPPSRRLIELVNSYVDSWVIEPQLSYSTKLLSGNIDLLVGTTLQSTSKELFGQNASGFANDDQIESIVAGTTKNITQYIPSEYHYSAIYSRIGYNLLDKYIINLTGRRDGSSRFGPGRQFGNFGAIGAGWIISQEPWFKKISIITFAKLRASYGITGNDRLPDYKFLSTYSYATTSYQGVTGLNPTQLTNPLFGWETVNKFEAGLESRWLQNRITFDVSYYRNRTEDQLVGFNLPYVTGFSNVTGNLPAVIQNSGLELQLSSVFIKRSNLTWTTSFNISIPRNKLVSYPGINGSSYSTRYKVGMPLSLSYVYNYTGIDKTTGMYTFLDKNNDGQITAALDREFIETGQKFFGGIDNTLRYKSFRLDVFLSFVKQTGISYPYYNIPGQFFSGFGNQPSGYLTNPEFQKTTSTKSDVISNYSKYNLSDEIYGDASYVRLKNVMLAWEFSSLKPLQRVFKGGNIFISAQNLFTITNYKGFDPESQSGIRLPPLRVIALGINCKL